MTAGDTSHFSVSFAVFRSVFRIINTLEQTNAQRRLAEAEASQRAAERNHERALAAVREEAKKKVLTSLRLPAAHDNFLGVVQHAIFLRCA